MIPIAKYLRQTTKNSKQAIGHQLLPTHQLTDSPIHNWESHHPIRFTAEIAEFAEKAQRKAQRLPLRPSRPRRWESGLKNPPECLRNAIRQRNLL